MMELIEWILTGSGAGLLIRWAYSAWKRGKRTFSEQFEIRAEIYEAMNEVMQSTDCKRFMILKSENGGGKPRVNAHIYASALYEDCRPPFRNMKSRYQRVPLDKDYVAMLRRISMEEEGHVNLVTDKMDYSLLRQIYEDEGVAFSQVFYLHETTKSFYYCSVSTDEAGVLRMTGNSDQLQIRIAIAKIKNIFEKHVKHE